MENLILEMAEYVIGSLTHNWLPLLLAIIIAAVMLVNVDPEKVKNALIKRSGSSIPAVVAIGAFTPLCACGTMAVIIGMLTTSIPWAPVMAFLTSSPLMSPDGFILVAGIINTEFAFALAASSVLIGLASGYITHIIEKKTGFLKNQTRFSGKIIPPADTTGKHGCSCSQGVEIPIYIQNHENKKNLETGILPCCEQNLNVGEQSLHLCCVASDSFYSFEKTSYSEFIMLKAADKIRIKIQEMLGNIKWRETGKAIINIGFKQILFYYAVFAAVGFLINQYVPAEIILSLFSPENILAVPVAAVVGLPLYFNGESAIPLIKSLMDSGAGSGAMLAFLITGPGTSAGVVAGIATILKKRAIILYITFLLSGGIILGYLYELYLFFK